jgi:hypothetical protein
MTDMNELHHGHIVVGLRAEASNGDSTCSQLAEDAADYIELLEYYLRCESTWQPYAEKLEAALRGIASVSKMYAANSEDMAQALTILLTSHRKIALAALEGKDEA